MDAHPRDLGNCVCGALQERVLQRDRELVSETRAGWRATALERPTRIADPKLNPDVSGRRWLSWPSRRPAGSARPDRMGHHHQVAAVQSPRSAGSTGLEEHENAPAGYN